jgi:hypothetical protein
MEGWGRSILVIGTGSNGEQRRVSTTSTSGGARTPATLALAQPGGQCALREGAGGTAHGRTEEQAAQVGRAMVRERGAIEQAAQGLGHDGRTP